MHARTSLIALALAAVVGCQEQGRMVTPVLGTHSPSRESLGRQMDVQVDMGRHVNDVAFWWGTAPDDVLVVIGRDLRAAEERAWGQPAARAVALPATGVVTLRGTIEPVTYAEEPFGWGLTSLDVDRLAGKGVYLRLHDIVP